MQVFRNLLTKSIFGFGKRVVEMRPAKISPIQDTNIASKPVPTTSNTPVTQKKTPIHIHDWETMQFDKLCALSPEQLLYLETQVKKTKMNVEQQFFASDKQITNPQAQLPAYWVNVYQMFCNLKSISEQKIQRIKKNAYLAQIIFDEQPENDEGLKHIIQLFVNNLHDVKKLEGVAEATFCKYLLSLKRDLKMQGLDIESFIDYNPKNVKIVKILSYQYQFWVDVKHNRSKNGTQNEFIILKKNVQNPNTTILLTQQFPTVDITFIKRKKKREDIQMNYVIKMLVEIEVDDKKHVIKVEKKGPSSKEETELRNEFLVIDYDVVFKGNPTIRPIFQF